MNEHRLTIDRIKCDGRGICADVVPELVEHARRAVANCPVRALRLSHSRLPEN